MSGNHAVSSFSPFDLTALLAARVHGPYADEDTAGVAVLAAEAVRYLNYSAPRGGVTDPATVYAVCGGLSDAAYRLPQLLSALGRWLEAETSVGRLADDHRRPPAELAVKIRDVFGDAGECAAGLARALNTAHNLVSTLSAAGGAGA